MDLKRLTQTAGPWWHVLVADGSDVCANFWDLERSAPQRLVLRVVRGHKATTKCTLFDEIAAALQFPSYFGENWDALHDCLGDLGWLRAEAVVLCVANATNLLANAADRDAGNFRDLVNEVAGRWNRAKPPQAPVPFHVVLVVAPEEEEALRRRWQALGVTLDRLE